MEPALDFDFAEALLAWERIDTGYLRVGRQAVTQVTREAEQALEVATARSGLGRLSKAWTSRIYPKAGLAREPAGYIYPKGGRRTAGAIRSFSRGARIRGMHGGYTAFATPAAGPRPRGRDLTPEEWERRTGQKLRPVFRPGRAPLLVADGRLNARSGRFRPLLKRDARKFGPGVGATIVIFILMPEYSHQARFSIEGTLAPFPGRLATRFVDLANQGE
jgi:Family of unknown function (DUF6441)